MTELDYPEPFGYKCSWLAIQASAPEPVVSALGLRNVRKSGWQNGIAAAYIHNGEAFVTPAIKGWILVASFSLPSICDTFERCKLSALVTRLAQQFADVQYFGTHRIVGYHAWLRATHGKVIRRYAFLGESFETLCNDGKLTEEEKNLSLRFDDNNTPSENDVMKIAGAWSIDPTELDAMGLDRGFGYLGTIETK